MNKKLKPSTPSQQNNKKQVLKKYNKIKCSMEQQQMMSPHLIFTNSLRNLYQVEKKADSKISLKSK